METKIKCCNLCAVLLTSENLAKRTQRCIPCHSASEKERHKKYRDNNIEKCLKKGKEYREKHKEYYSELSKTKYQCECGSIISNGSTSIHKKCARHIAWVNYMANYPNY